MYRFDTKSPVWFNPVIGENREIPKKTTQEGGARRTAERSTKNGCTAPPSGNSPENPGSSTIRYRINSVWWPAPSLVKSAVVRADGIPSLFLNRGRGQTVPLLQGCAEEGPRPRGDVQQVESLPRILGMRPEEIRRGEADATGMPGGSHKRQGCSTRVFPSRYRGQTPPKLQGAMSSAHGETEHRESGACRAFERNLPHGRKQECQIYREKSREEVLNSRFLVGTYR
jgi:hypothetical protein